MTCEPTQIMMGMSAETFWGGLEGNAEFTKRLREVCGDEIGISTGANALDESLKVFGAKKVAALTPYQSVGDEQVRRFLEETGYEVSKVIGLKCDSATSIAHTPPSEVIDVVLNELEGSDVDAIVQAGTNLSAVNQFPALEQLLGKPVIPINVATIWHTFRTIGIQDKIFGKGWLFERY
jgi:maleate isomerase